MGAWGHGILDNDNALDILDVIEAKVGEVNVTNIHGILQDYLLNDKIQENSELFNEMTKVLEENKNHIVEYCKEYNINNLENAFYLTFIFNFFKVDMTFFKNKLRHSYEELFQNIWEEANTYKDIKKREEELEKVRKFFI